MNIYEAMEKRKSVRSFQDRMLPAGMISKIREFYKQATRLEPEIETKLEILDTRADHVSIKGMWKISAPYYLVLYSEEKPGYERNAGYIAEQMVLYLTAKGLGSCYLGASKAAGRTVEGMKQVIIIAFGYGDELIYRDPGEAKRLPISELCIFREEPSNLVLKVLKAARLAPSSLNSQPWRFIAGKEKIHVYAGRGGIMAGPLGSLREINMGILLCHMMLAAEDGWTQMHLEQDKHLAKKVYKKGEYVGTAVFR